MIIWGDDPEIASSRKEADSQQSAKLHTLRKLHLPRKQTTSLPIAQFQAWLEEQELSSATVSKYVRDVRRFVRYVNANTNNRGAHDGAKIAINGHGHGNGKDNGHGHGKGKSYGNGALTSGKGNGKAKANQNNTGNSDYVNAAELTKKTVVEYKAWLIEQYAPASVNCMLASLNRYLVFVGRSELKVKQVKMQRTLYRNESRDLTREEYEHLVATAQAMGRYRTALIIQTLAATGIRVSELRFVTAQTVREGRMVVSNKGKTRCVWLPEKLRRALLQWIDVHRVGNGPLFCSQSGKELDRVYIWREMKLVAQAAHIEASKVFPHNLRHLFAVAYYRQFHDLAALCDLLGHERVETTRIYVAVTEQDRRKQLAALNLVA